MPKIVACLKDINKIYYSGYTITKVYACGGELVFDSGSSFLVHNRYNSGGTITRLDLGCEYGSQIDCDHIKPYTMNPCHEEGDVHIIDSVMGGCAINIGASAYRDCPYLTAVTFGNNVETVGYQSFAGCTSLPSVTMPNSVTSIDGAAFSGCTNLTGVTIGSGITSIGSQAFKSCKRLGAIMVGKGITIKAATPPTIYSDTFSDTGTYFKIYVPSTSVEEYKSAWPSYADKIQAIT